MPLTSLIQAYTSLELLNDTQCRRCRVLQTLKTLRQTIPPSLPSSMTSTSLPTPSSSSPSSPSPQASVHLSPAPVHSSSMPSPPSSPSPSKKPKKKSSPSSTSSQPPSSLPLTASKKKRLNLARKELDAKRQTLARVERLVEDKRWEDDLEGLPTADGRWELVDGGFSTRLVLGRLLDPKPGELQVHPGSSFFPNEPETDFLLLHQFSFLL